MALALSAIAVASCALTPQYAAADATPGPSPAPGAPGLPDGRVYEEVSPPNKNGNEVNESAFGMSSANGNAALYFTSGAVGASYGSTPGAYVARRSPSGWTTESALPGIVGLSETFDGPEVVVPSPSFEHFLFTSTWGTYVSGQPFASTNIFLSTNPAQEPAWLGEPQISKPVPLPGFVPTREYIVAGASPKLGTVYFTYPGTLLPEDSPRAAHVNVNDFREHNNTSRGALPWGYYEWSSGSLHEAGVLPDGKLSPFGAVPAATGGAFPRTNSINLQRFAYPQYLDNQVSADGSRAFFVSPDPEASSVTDETACSGAGVECTSEPPELYVRETLPDGAKRSVLVSRSELAGHRGQPAPAGVLDVGQGQASQVSEHTEGASFIYASPNGAQVFFASKSQLTGAAPVGESVKEYDFDVNTETLTYIPGVNPQPIITDETGTSLLFKDTATATPQLAMWTAGASGGKVTPIAENLNSQVKSARSVAAGGVFLFSTASALPGFNNGGGKYEQVYRYDVSANELTCVSCPGRGTTPTAGANASQDEGGRPDGKALADQALKSTIGTRIASSDGSRIFFETSQALVPQDTNNLPDVYEWENNHVYLITTGTSSTADYLLDESASGSDVFFTTAQPLSAADSGGGYDVYDARIPRPGDRPPPTATPCEGSVCQGPPSTPHLLSTPASATFSGEGNLVVKRAPSRASNAASMTRKRKLNAALKTCNRLYRGRARKRARCTRRAQRRLMTRTQKLHSALGACRRAHRHNRRARRSCEQGARRRFGAKAASRRRRAAGRDRGKAGAGQQRRTSNRHHDRRGK